MLELDSISNEGEGPTLTEFEATSYLNTSAYDYEGGTRCGWHEQREVKFCSLNYVNIYRLALQMPPSHTTIVTRL